MKHSILILFFFCKLSMVIAQNDNSRLTEGTCKEVINNLRKIEKNDSIVINILKSRYQFINTGKVERAALLKKNYVEMIMYFYSEEGKDCFCRPMFKTVKRIKRLEYPLLLMDEISPREPKQP
jgi:hypothetical protein